VIVNARDVSMTFSDRTVLQRISVLIHLSDQCALTGRSGSGKTTLLLVLAGLLTPTEGQVEFGVQPRDIVYVPQAPALVPELTVVQNASLGLRVRGVAPGEAEDAARVQLRALGLDDADDSLPSELSGGMQQRAALARALATRPLLLLADEPTGALDQATGRLVVAALKAQAAQTSTALVVATHDPDVSAQFDRQLSADEKFVR
jgi:ABC-type lipoprotein export system ATPase subunit